MARPGSRPAPSIALAFALLGPGLGLSGCSLNLEDPEVEARKKLEKVAEPSWDLLEGRWAGDSTYTVFDDRATGLAGQLVLDIFPDSSLWSRDDSRKVFPGGLSARASLGFDTLHILPAPGQGSPGTFHVKLRFLGNWLELHRASDRRSTHFHKLKPMDSSRREVLLDSGLWIRRLRRIAYDTSSAEPLRRDFDYLRFPGDSLHMDTRRNGLSAVLAGPLRPAGKRWTWSPGGPERTVHIDLFHPDSLRFWPYSGGRPDSGYSLYTRGSRAHPLDLDMTAWIGHLRTDSVKAGLSETECHYGRYFDLVLGRDHSVSTLTNMPGMPLFKTWSVDSGFLFMEGDSPVKQTRFSVRKISGKSLSLVSDSSGGFSRTTALVQTLVDGSTFADRPLDRFDQAGFLHLTVGTETLAYYFLSASNRNNPEEHEIALIRASGASGAPDTAWAAWRVHPAQETFGSSQSGFLFAFSGRTQALGRFTCRSSPDLDLTLRATASGDPALARGLVQGTCRLTEAETMPPDSVLAVTGEFRSRRRSAALSAPFWSRP